ncbi:MAG: ribosomal protein S18-alanine N-acetyltransferase [Chitinispirillales bacterium]|jgi:ribosomal-protein-alanine N-acetyltransferase|nr:ribosomal protein S18-alanine N-acetyltransferase [Chitinispirillales bacterium]
MSDNTNIIIRPADPEDIGQIYSIELECNQSPWTYAGLAAELANPNSMFLTMEQPQNGKIIGFACIASILEEIQINNIAIHPDYQGRGLGPMLINHALAKAAAEGASHAYLEVRESNIPAIKAYEKCGFTSYGVRKRYYRDGENAVLMSATLFTPRI